MNITEREKDILRMLHLPNRIIARKLNISLSTVKTHITRLLAKFYWVENRTELLYEALNQNIIHLEQMIRKEKK